MDPLTQILMQRAMAGQQPQAPSLPPAPQAPTPIVPPSGGQTNTPPEAKRFTNAVQIQNAYRTGHPNPVLLQAMLAGK